jgi:predicted site-specific integrase-resolvase
VRAGKVHMKKYGTPQAAKLIGVSSLTLHRWLRDKKIHVAGIQLADGRMLYQWTDADIARGRKVKAAQKPGPKPKG